MGVSPVLVQQVSRPRCGRSRWQQAGGGLLVAADRSLARRWRTGDTSAPPPVVAMSLRVDVLCVFWGVVFCFSLGSRRGNFAFRSL
jgi:hypothetical protein